MVATPRVHMLSLSATGTPASGPGSSTGRDRGVDRGRRRPGGVGAHEVEGVDLVLAGFDRGEVSLDDVGRT